MMRRVLFVLVAVTAFAAAEGSALAVPWETITMAWQNTNGAVSINYVDVNGVWLAWGRANNPNANFFPDPTDVPDYYYALTLGIQDKLDKLDKTKTWSCQAKIQRTPSPIAIINNIGALSKCAIVP